MFTPESLGQHREPFHRITNVGMDQTNITKLTGLVCWMNPLTGDIIDRGSSEHAILRPDGLAMDINAGMGMYSVGLKRAGTELKFNGGRPEDYIGPEPIQFQEET